MRYAGFYIFYCINWVMTLLPLKILYVFSDFLYILFFYFPGYRRKVVEENLHNSFPEKSEKELITIEKRFYRHLADIFIETLKLTHLSNEELKKRFYVTNPGLLDQLYQSGKDLVVVHSHYNNWEWLACLPLFTSYKIVVIYKPLRNKLFDNFVNRLRTMNNVAVVPTTSIVRSIMDNRNKNIRAVYGFLADQTPALPYIQYRTQFLNQDTPVHLGIEKIAAKYGMPVVFFNVQKVKRGFYTLTVELLFEKTKGLPEYLVTDTHVKRLEELIRKNPEYWIWTHKRWKYKKQPDA
ncbi:MAG: lysophospholipid acyltransferase family protein [Bacteroidales bacterium]